MIKKKDVNFLWNVYRSLSSKGILLQSVNYNKLKTVAKKHGVDIIMLSKKKFNEFKKTERFENLMSDAKELFKLGYGVKFISLCVSLKYKTYISSHFFHRHINLDRLKNSINDQIFSKANIILNGRVLYNPTVSSFYLTFQCTKIRKQIENKEVRVNIFFDSSFKKIYLDRDNCARKKIHIHQNEFFVSLYPIPKKFEELRSESYDSKNVKVYLDSNDFDLKRSELICDKSAGKLYPCLNEFGFEISKERVTNVDRSAGDLHVYKNGQKYIIEITKRGERASSNPNNVRLMRELLLGKIARIGINNKEFHKFLILSEKLKEIGVTNIDFQNIIKYFNIQPIFTNFKGNWAKKVAKEIDQKSN